MSHAGRIETRQYDSRERGVERGGMKRNDRSVDNVSGAGAADVRDLSRMNRIAERAHEIYERRGGAHGRTLDDWLQAEREIDAEN